MWRTTNRALALTLLWVGCVGGPSDELDQLSETEHGLNLLSGSVWANSDIPVCWETAGNDADKAIVRDAIRKTWEAESALEFTGWGTCHSGTTSGIRIKTSDEWPRVKQLGNGLNNLVAGMLLNFEFANYPTQFSDCQRGDPGRDHCIRAVAVHEFGHALGFAHEQLRPDTPESCTQGQPIGDIGGDTLIGTWDLQSVMNYCNPSWNNGGMLSPTDIAGVQQVYGTRKPVASVAWNPSRVDAFVHRHDNVLGSTIAGVAPFPITGAPAMVSTQPGRADVFLRGPDGTLFTSRFDGTHYSAMVQVNPMPIVGSPAAVVRGGYIHVVVRGADNAVHVITFNGSTWSSYVALGGTITGTPVAVTNGTTIDVFVRGLDAGVWRTHFDGSTWSGFTSLGGVIAGNPAAVYMGPDQLSVFVRGYNDGLFQINRIGGVWDAGFSFLSADQFRGDPAVVSWGPNRLDIFVRGYNGDLYHKYWTGTAWTGFSWLSGTLRATPTVFAPANNRLEILVRGADSNLWRKSWNGSSWSALQPMGTSVK